MSLNCDAETTETRSIIIMFFIEFCSQVRNKGFNDWFRNAAFAIFRGYYDDPDRNSRVLWKLTIKNRTRRNVPESSKVVSIGVAKSLSWSQRIRS